MAQWYNSQSSTTKHDEKQILMARNEAQCSTKSTNATEHDDSKNAKARQRVMTHDDAPRDVTKYVERLQRLMLHRTSPRYAMNGKFAIFVILPIFCQFLHALHRHG